MEYSGQGRYNFQETFPEFALEIPVMPAVAPYGSWKSSITTDLIASGAVDLGQIALDGDDVYWVEMRPSEGGRMVIVRHTADGETIDVTPEPYSVRTLVHEYGGGAFLAAEGTVFFSNHSDQRMYRQDAGTEPSPITPESPLRYADGVFDTRRGRVICVREDHTGEGEPVNAIVAVDAEGRAPQETLYAGSDFCAAPRLSPDGNRLAWLSWDHPNMPWDGTTLWVAGINQDGSLDEAQPVAGGVSESIFQPEWSPDGALYFVSDRTGWYNLYRWQGEAVQPVCPQDADFGNHRYNIGNTTYGFESAGHIIASCSRNGAWGLVSIDTVSGSITSLESGTYTEIEKGGGLLANPGVATFIAGSPVEPLSVVRLTLPSGKVEALRQSKAPSLDANNFATPETIEFPTENGLTAHAFYYPPHNPGFAAPPGERPPLLVKSHGGPTSSASPVLDLEIQFWTSRGFGVVDVNYGGSTGYGREYRDRLKGHWGIMDVDDCVNAARFLAARGDADPQRLAIDGGSAGGYTTLAALTFRDIFQAGASYYGVSDLDALAKETHKFESRYLDSLVGPYPERRDLYVERSPIHHTRLLSCPLILLQGLEDKIVPPNQAEMMFEAVKSKGLPTAYVLFEGEQHGFRRSENIKRALEAELYFYSRVFGFELADDVEPLEIENLPG